MSQTHFVEVYRAENTLDAHLMKGALEAAGIPAQVTEEVTAALRPNLWWGAPRLLVTDGDAAEAAAVIREVQTARTNRRSSDAQE